MCRICDIIGESKITPDPDAVRLGEWIDCEVAENGQPIFGKIRKNISYYLGNEDLTIKLSEATDKLFKRDYKGKNQIFVPDIFITKNPEMLFTQSDTLEEALLNSTLSEKDKGKWRCRLNTVSGKSIFLIYTRSGASIASKNWGGGVMRQPFYKLPFEVTIHFSH